MLNFNVKTVFALSMLLGSHFTITTVCAFNLEASKDIAKNFFGYLKEVMRDSFTYDPHQDIDRCEDEDELRGNILFVGSRLVGKMKLFDKASIDGIHEKYNTYLSEMGKQISGDATIPLTAVFKQEFGWDPPEETRESRKTFNLEASKDIAKNFFGYLKEVMGDSFTYDPHEDIDRCENEDELRGDILLVGSRLVGKMKILYKPYIDGIHEKYETYLSEMAKQISGDDTIPLTAVFKQEFGWYYPEKTGESRPT